MLLLVGSERALGAIWVLLPGKQLTVGRKDTPLLVEDDKSVSRKHATIFTGDAGSTDLKVQDEGSTFGIQIDGSKCPESSISQLKAGSKITFGGQKSVFELRSLKIALYIADDICSSELHQKMVDSAGKLGIKVVKGMEDATHMVVSTLAVTTEVVSALVCGCYFVTSEYILNLGSNIKATARTNGCPVDEFIGTFKFLPQTHTPPVSANSSVDISAVDWSPDTGCRSQLFCSKQCVFFDEQQYQRYHSLIDRAGGSCVLLKEESTLELTKRIKSLDTDGNTSTYLISAGSAADSALTSLVEATATQLGLKMIPESEIGLAIAFASCKDYMSSPLIGPQQKTVPGKRRRQRLPRISNFWSDKISSHGNVVSEENKQEDKPVAPAETNTEQIPATTSNNSPNPSKTTVSLIKRKPIQHGTNGTDTTGPNFKRFKKTVHLYQM